MTTEALSIPTTVSPTESHVTVFVDLDTVLLAAHPGKYGPELSVQSDLPEALDRLSEVADRIVVLVDPPRPDAGHVMETSHRVEVLRAGLGDAADSLVIATCPHARDEQCECAKPGNELIQTVMSSDGGLPRGGWYVGGDQEGVVAGRTAGLHTIRIGPLAEDHLSAVHRADYDARDLMDAATRIMLEVLAAD
jgi:D-glycero-D-manno-heptose 1,7-bisphosphate phosphatase